MKKKTISTFWKIICLRDSCKEKDAPFPGILRGKKRRNLIKGYKRNARGIYWDFIKFSGEKRLPPLLGNKKKLTDCFAFQTEFSEAVCISGQPILSTYVLYTIRSYEEKPAHSINFHWPSYIL